LKALDGIRETVESIQSNDKELNENSHFSFILDHQIYVSVIGLKGYTLPSVEWQRRVCLLILAVCIEVVYYLLVDSDSHHPESCRKTPVNKSSYLVK
jgi:hypothetical protein